MRNICWIRLILTCNKIKMKNDCRLRNRFSIWASVATVVKNMFCVRRILEFEFHAATLAHFDEFRHGRLGNITPFACQRFVQCTD